MIYATNWRLKYLNIYKKSLISSINEIIEDENSILNISSTQELEKNLFDLEVEKEIVKEEKVVKQKPKSNLSLGKLEDKISKVEEKIEKLKKSQFEEEIYSDSKKMQEIDEQINQLEEELTKLTEEYLERA